MHLTKSILLFILCLTGTAASASPFNTPPTITDTTLLTCSKSPEITRIINEAISLGAPIYNEGMHLACYRIYEWASYKIIYEYPKECKEIVKILKTAIDKSHGDFSDTEKAWLMRAAFDAILGEPTRTSPTQNPENQRKG
ncbi:MAG: hypothetical protein JST68_04140 [Bacteroidetes bacterium]|nr:hypothetical protein [Bacteroidota bacterium]